MNECFSRQATRKEGQLEGRIGCLMGGGCGKS